MWEMMNDTTEKAGDAKCQSMVNICYNCYEFIYLLNIVASLMPFIIKKIVSIEIVVHVIKLHSIF